MVKRRKPHTTKEPEAYLAARVERASALIAAYESILAARPSQMANVRRVLWCQQPTFDEMLAELLTDLRHAYNTPGEQRERPNGSLAPRRRPFDCAMKTAIYQTT